MQGTSYGDTGLASAMTAELGRRLETAANEGRPLRVYCGFDPRTADLHLGHTVPLTKLRQFQDLGHEVTVVVGTFTSLVGDPSDKREGRELMRREEVRRNGRTYAEQAFRILDPARTRVAFNDEWLSPIGLEEFAGLASRFTVQQLVGRENFKARWDRGEPIQLQETFYPILQARDACELRADVQVGGSDQLFNIVTASRRLMETCGLVPNVAVIVALLPGTDGKTKMSKSLGNHIPLQSSAADMFGQLMSLPDEAMRTYFDLLTTLPTPEVAALLAGHPRTAKARLAREVTARFHSAEAADAAVRAFDRVFSRGEAPDTMPAHPLVPGETVAAALVRIGAAGSSSEARRLVTEGGVRLDGVRLTDPLAPMRPGVLRAGRRRFYRIGG
ncbi:MAG: tyrosine--tRNA ligase [Spirochaetes bacterium RBG_13_68_11]|nr:MAG: tyrosine--tRNA ligase [Spirochaetes bacterium RBG_13_68_11]